jgi:ketosteroid isomerase-like protein
VSEDSVAIVRRALRLLGESHEQGELSEGLLALCAPDVRIDASRRVFNPEVYDGVAGVCRAIRDITDAWESFHERHDRIIDAGERVLVIQTITGRGRASGVPVEQRGALIWTVRDGLIRLIEVFLDPDEALAAVGLSGQPRSG